MRRKWDLELKAGVFVVFGLFIVMGTILLMGGGESLFQRSYKLYVVLPDASGLAKGAVIRSGGLKVGRVDDISFSEHYDSVKIAMLLEQKFKPRVRTDSIVKLQTQGVLGDKYLEITGGSEDKPVAEEGAVIEAEASKDLSAMLATGETAVQLLKENLSNLRTITGELAGNNSIPRIMRNLNDATNNLKDITDQLKRGQAIAELNQTMKNLRVVSERVKNGEGTIGALFTDSSLYEDMKHLIGGASRNNVLKFFVRHAVKTSDDQELKEEEASEAAKKKK